MAQAKIDNVKPAELLDKLTYASPAQLFRSNNKSYLMLTDTKSSRLGVRQTLATKRHSI